MTRHMKTGIRLFSEEEIQGLFPNRQGRFSEIQEIMQTDEVGHASNEIKEIEKSLSSSKKSKYE